MALFPFAPELDPVSGEAAVKAGTPALLDTITQRR